MEINILVLGSPEVGKTALLEKYMGQELSASYEPTQQHVFTKDITVEKKAAKLELVDIGGAPSASVDRDALIKKADGIVIVFDITKGDSLDAAKTIKQHVMEQLHDKLVPIILIGNKDDMEDQREVTEAQGNEAAKEMQITFFETSAISGKNVEEAFTKLVALVHEKATATATAKPAKKKGGCCILQ